MLRSTLFSSLFSKNPRRRQRTASRQRLSFESLEAKDLLATVTLAAGSTDGLADAIDQAGQGGTVIVESGLHEETGGVTVAFPVSIIGEPGAVIRVTTNPTFDPAADAALLVQGADRTRIEGISLEASSGLGNVGVRVEDSDHVTMTNNVITDYLFGVFIASGDHVEVGASTISGPAGLDFGYCCVGILTGTVAHTRIIGNDISEFDLGVFAAGLKGQMQFNSLHDNNIGVILCQSSSADSPATRWHVTNNNAYDNVLFGYLVTDFATNNFLANNAASNNGVGVPDGADILLDGDPFPPSIETLVALGSHQGLVVLDFGINNKVNGG